MSQFRWGPEGPPPEAYSRVTNPERFAPLHGFALELLDRLETDFDVERTEAYGLDPEVEIAELARPSIRLVPRHDDAAPIFVAFSTFPGLRVKVGRWYTTGFPSCGCDACDETADDEAERLASIVDDVTAGRFHEAIRLPLLGKAWHETEFWSAHGSHSSKGRLDRARARQMLAGSDLSAFEWRPWTHK